MASTTTMMSKHDSHGCGGDDDDNDEDLQASHCYYTATSTDIHL